MDARFQKHFVLIHQTQLASENSIINAHEVPFSDAKLLKVKSTDNYSLQASVCAIRNQQVKSYEFR
jgi:hypothetical protein